MDSVFIEALRVDCCIGIYDFEKVNQQPLFFDLELFYDNHQAGLTDDYNLVIDYAKVCEDIENWCKQSKCELVETVAEQICEMLFTKYPIDKISLKINKPEAVANVKAIGIKIFRERKYE